MCGDVLYIKQEITPNGISDGFLNNEESESCLLHVCETPTGPPLHPYQI